MATCSVLPRHEQTVQESKPGSRPEQEFPTGGRMRQEFRSAHAHGPPEIGDKGPFRRQRNCSEQFLVPGPRHSGGNILCRSSIDSANRCIEVKPAAPASPARTQTATGARGRLRARESRVGFRPGVAPRRPARLRVAAERVLMQLCCNRVHPQRSNQPIAAFTWRRIRRRIGPERVHAARQVGYRRTRLGLAVQPRQAAAARLPAGVARAIPREGSRRGDRAIHGEGVTRVSKRDLLGN